MAPGQDLAEAPWAALAVPLAQRTELARLTRSGWRAGPRLEAWSGDDALATESDAAALELWDDVYTAVERRLAPRVLEQRDPVRRRITTQMDAWAAEITLAMVVALYRRVGDDEGPADVASLIRGFSPGRQAFGGEQPDMPQVLAKVLGTLLRDQLLTLADLGSVAFSGPGLPALEAAMAERASAAGSIGRLLRPVVLSSTPEVTVGLTPLGVWAVREALLAEGVDAPAR